MIGLADITHTVDAYLERHPEDRLRLAPLLASIDDKAAITDRSTFTGHVTCSAVLVDPQWRVLHIRHNALGTWLRPGGHVEPTDRSPHDAALRELFEETGIPASLVSPLCAEAPIDIDVHLIPANPGKPEPEHPHFDLRYAFALLDASAAPTLQADEVSAYQWMESDSVQPETLRERLTLLRRAV